MPSVMEAAMNIAEASNSFVPCALLKWFEDRIQISKGMLQMRISVMEFGRFTAAREVSGRAPELKLIMLHGARERNRGNVLLRQESFFAALPKIAGKSIL